MDTPKPMQGTWTLTAPDGRAWQGDSPLRCAGIEQRERVPASVAMERIIAGANEGEPTDADLLKLAHQHKYDGPPAADLRIVAMLRAARNWTDA